MAKTSLLIRCKQINMITFVVFFFCLMYTYERNRCDLFTYIALLVRLTSRLSQQTFIAKATFCSRKQQTGICASKCPWRLFLFFVASRNYCVKLEAQNRSNGKERHKVTRQGFFFVVLWHFRYHLSFLLEITKIACF